MRVRTRQVLLVAALLLLCGACGDPEQGEAWTFLDRYDLLDQHAPFDEQREQLDALERLPFQTERVKDVRDRCVEGLRALLASEVDKVLVGEAVPAMERGEAPNTPEDRQRIEEALARSTRAAARAGELVPSCIDDVAALRTRYRRRRH